MKKSKLIHENWNKKNKFTRKQLVKNFIKAIIPKYFMQIYRKLKLNNDLSYENFINGDGNSWCLRVLYKNINNNE